MTPSKSMTEEEIFEGSSSTHNCETAQENDYSMTLICSR